MSEVQKLYNDLHDQLHNLRLAIDNMAASAAQMYVYTRLENHIAAARELHMMLEKTYTYIPIAKYDKNFNKD